MRALKTTILLVLFISKTLIGQSSDMIGFFGGAAHFKEFGESSWAYTPRFESVYCTTGLDYFHFWNSKPVMGFLASANYTPMNYSILEYEDPRMATLYGLPVRFNGSEEKIKCGNLLVTMNVTVTKSVGRMNLFLSMGVGGEYRLFQNANKYSTYSYYSGPQYTHLDSTVITHDQRPSYHYLFGFFPDLKLGAIFRIDDHFSFYLQGELDYNFDWMYAAARAGLIFELHR